MSTICFPGKGQWQFKVVGMGNGNIMVSIVRKINVDLFIWCKLFDILGPISYLFDKKHKEMQEDIDILCKELENYINE